MRGTVRDWLKQLGPGLITGAADDDPSGIATYSQAGAQFGFLTLWTIVFTYPLMVGIQLISARIGRVTGHGLASNIGRNFPRPVLHVIVALLVLFREFLQNAGQQGERRRLVVQLHTVDLLVLGGRDDLGNRRGVPWEEFAGGFQGQCPVIPSDDPADVGEGNRVKLLKDAV